MVRSAEADLRALGDFVARLPKPDDPRSFGAAVLDPLRTLVDCDSVTYNEVDLRLHRNFCIVSPGDSLDGGDPAAFEAHLHQHPVISYGAATGDGRAHTISDFLTRPQFHRTDLWNSYYRPVGVDVQIAICVALEPDVVVGIAFNRAAPDFDARDREILNVARPLLIASYRSAQEACEQRQVIEAFDAALARDGQGVIAYRSDGRVYASTSSADRLLTAYLGAPIRKGQRLPARLVEVLDAPRGPHRAAVIDGPRGSLRLRRMTHEEHQLLVLDELPHATPSGSTGSPPITARERDVLDLLSSGRTTGQVADELGISPRTVDKHLEHIRAKLDVPSRTAAVARWLTG